MKLSCFAVFGTAVLSSTFLAQTGSHQTSGIYQASADFQNGRLEFEGACGSKFQKLELHDVFHEPYIDLTHGSQKQRLFKAKLFGFRACDGYDYRFDADLEYRILEAKEACIYVRETHFSRYQSGRISTYYFSVGPGGKLLPLTVSNLKLAFAQNQTFRDSLDSSFTAHQTIEQYDEGHGMFKVNYLLKASHASDH